MISGGEWTPALTTSNSIAGAVVELGEGIIVNDAKADPRFDDNVDSAEKVPDMHACICTHACIDANTHTRTHQCMRTLARTWHVPMQGRFFGRMSRRRWAAPLLPPVVSVAEVVQPVSKIESLGISSPSPSHAMGSHRPSATHVGLTAVVAEPLLSLKAWVVVPKA